MSWWTVEEAATRGPSQGVWLQRIDAGTVDSYVDGDGRCWVWIDPAQDPVLDPRVLGRAFESLRRRVDALEDVPGPHPVVLTPVPAPLTVLPPVATSAAGAGGALPGGAAPEAAVDPEQVLALVAARWSGSDRELERQAGLPKAFLAKAKRGQRGGLRSVASWERLAQFLGGATARRAA